MDRAATRTIRVHQYLDILRRASFTSIPTTTT